jgi:hypothetical protein
MKTGLSLTQLASELERQSQTKKDFIAPQGKLTAVVVADEDARVDVQIDGINGQPFPITNYAHGQLSDHLGIPKKYYDRMRAERPALLADNVNSWLHADPANKRMVRTLDGKVRAFMSPKYRPLDNFDLASTILPVLIENQVTVVSCELTETRMYVKGILESLSDELPAGLAYGTGHANIRQAGDRGRLVAAITVSNSDIGAGTLRIEPSVFTTWCTNLAIMQDAAMKKYHVGRAHSADDASYEVFSDATRQADDKAFWLKAKDVTMAAFREDLFRAAIDRIKACSTTPIKSDDLPKVVELTIEALALPPALNGGILKHLAAGGDLTQWGLSSAITRVANDADDYELATTLEHAGGAVLQLAGPTWKRIAEAA